MSGGPILLFDSGIGGLTVLREARVLMPERRFVYVADDAGFPYGVWGEGDLTKRIVTMFEQLISDHEPAQCVIACNTASTLVLEPLRTAFPDMPFVGTVPAIKPASERTRSGLVSVLATPGTVRRAYTRDLIQSFAAQCHVRLVGSEYLAGLAEAYIRGDPVKHRQILAEIEPCFVEQDGQKTDIVVLACTHYPFLANQFRRLAPWPVDWLDPAEAIAKRAQSLLAPQDAVSEEPDIAVFTSNEPDFAVRRLLNGFGLALAPMRH
ncbi:glutamate racemase [Nitratireductor sp. XY-223]|uniref:glutamate racemase n=1 Tax=Nitratireductor sp. XY-223 TaxID=2561926 RepID=UPI0010AB241C|nr:glutamate racemase [Nitratireductor sp. XY-223]